jgi:hypothetical protein
MGAGLPQHKHKVFYRYSNGGRSACDQQKVLQWINQSLVKRDPLAKQTEKPWGVVYVDFEVTSMWPRDLMDKHTHVQQV